MTRPSLLRVTNLGKTRYRVAIALPPVDGELGRAIVAKLLRKKPDGIRLPLDGEGSANG